MIVRVYPADDKDCEFDDEIQVTDEGSGPYYDDHMDYEISDDGCSSHSCHIKKPKGQGVNCGCCCFNHIFKAHRLKIMRDWNYRRG